MQGILARDARRKLCAALYQQHHHRLAPAAAALDQVREISSLSVDEGLAVAPPAAKSFDLEYGKFPAAFSAAWDGMRHYGRCYWELSKARLSILVVMTSGAGFVLGSGSVIDVPCLGWTCLGTMLAAASANSFNQILEVTNDSNMKRTMRRPLPSGRISMEHALAWAVTSGSVGISLLAYQTNATVAALGAGNILLYTLAYTPMKQLHPANTWIGAIVGAVPPLMGWAAASGHLDPGAWVLASALYFWQLPHFMALSFMCSKDYLAGGYKMVSGPKAALIALRNCAYLLPVGFIAHYAGVTSGFFGPEAAILTAGMGATAALFYRDPTLQRARHMFRASLLYLPALMFAMLLHRVPNSNTAKESLDNTAPSGNETSLEVVNDALLETSGSEMLEKKKSKRSNPEDYTRPPIAYASAAPFPFLPVPYFR
ncbi:protoheme IX farnesyltransferase, mitochondrial [Selaginella moellendorffii]|uniref:protoheme IX farnesyltransferase, mitochondrial n=1 Tax=Selaginella moellendorffii TaxID=88036 RepID=UPI000D1C5372|nr:protoheme IX farnesyltransferase, mitochondrial [Selaginella moellendorffii]|eukprot:XP_024525255.1 protoheme IX farnesyltransferase, mitochondrial [Selaginella moellendorffii]